MPLALCTRCREPRLVRPALCYQCQSELSSLIQPRVRPTPAQKRKRDRERKVRQSDPTEGREEIMAVRGRVLSEFLRN